MRSEGKYLWLLPISIAASVVLFVLFVVLPKLQNHEEEKRKSVALVIPEGISEKLPGSKIDSYDEVGTPAFGRYEEYFNSLSESTNTDNSSKLTADLPKPSSKNGTYGSTERVFGRQEENREAPKNIYPSYEERQRKNAKIAKEIVEDFKALSDKQDYEDKPEEHPISTEQPRQIDLGGMQTDRDGIISTWESTGDEIIHYGGQEAALRKHSPVKCMFVRDEGLTSGQRVTVRLLEDLKLDGGIIIPVNTHLSATCSINGRLFLTVHSLEMNGHIIHVGYQAYDIDGMEGIYCRESGENKTRERVMDDVTSTTKSVLGGIMGRVAGAALSTGASVLQSSTGTIRVSVQSGYQFYLYKEEKI